MIIFIIWRVVAVKYESQIIVSMAPEPELSFWLMMFSIFSARNIAVRRSLLKQSSRLVEGRTNPLHYASPRCAVSINYSRRDCQNWRMLAF